MASEPASHVKPVTKQTFGRASPEAAREAAPRAVPNGALVLYNAISRPVECVTVVIPDGIYLD